MRQQLRLGVFRFTPTGVGTISAAVTAASSRSVHPHGRGDNRNVSVISTGSRGSPPRAWGQSENQRLASRMSRFTPTGVGTIAGCRNASSPVTVHPHGRGDNCWTCATTSPERGSPPRAWGQYGVHHLTVSPRRFTPTGVGTIGWRSKTSGGKSVHPHGRGDNAIPSPTAYTLTRFTPTGVGTMSTKMTRRSAGSVHPHGRGDNSTLTKQ